MGGVRRHFLDVHRTVTRVDEIGLCDVARCAYCASHEMALIDMCHDARRGGGRSHAEGDGRLAVRRAHEGAQDQGEDCAGSDAHGCGATTSDGVGAEI
jgi:hypothetical protein